MSDQHLSIEELQAEQDRSAQDAYEEWYSLYWRHDDDHRVQPSIESAFKDGYVAAEQVNWQRQISDAVKARGYVQGELTKEQYAAQQLCKCVEEISELADTFQSDELWRVRTMLRQAAYSAKRLFDYPQYIGEVKLHRVQAEKELADVLVTIAMMGSVLGVDVAQRAILKSEGDKARGVRGG